MADTEVALADGKEEIWVYDDDRIPTITDRPKNKDFKDLKKSLKENGQIQEVTIAHIDGKYHIVAGRNRIQALQELKHDIRVRIIELDNVEEIIPLRMAENEARSKNEAADYLAIKERLLAGDCPDYKKIAKELFLPIAIVKKLDREWSCVPKDVIQGVVNGTIKPSIAKKVGRMPTTTQKACLKKFSKEKKLTGTMIIETKQAVKAEATGSIHFTSVAKRNSFSRQEIMYLLTLAEEGTNIHAAIVKLLE